jgi:hypothetical protein
MQNCHHTGSPLPRTGAGTLQDSEDPDMASTGQITAGPTTPSKSDHITRRGHRAAQTATAKNTVQIDLPVLGRLSLPPPEQLAYVAGIAALAALDIIEWPIGLTLAAGHLLAATRGNKALRDFGDALEEA